MPSIPVNVPCYSVVSDDGLEPASSGDLRTALQKGDDRTKLKTLRQIINMSLNGRHQPSLLMPIIQYILPSKNKDLKKLLHFYWEVCPKHDENGKLKQEMILVCNAVRNDLQHPNEYIRGITLRLLQKLDDAELIEPLIPSCRQNLEHRHSYVRKNAVLAVMSIYQSFPEIIPDAPEIMETFIAAESDATCRRNAFLLLCTIAPLKAHAYLCSVLNEVASMDSLFHLAVIDFIRRSADDGNQHESKYVRLIFELLEAGSSTVRYDAAITLTTFVQSPAAIKAAASVLIDLISTEADNNVKLIVLARLDDLRSRHPSSCDSLIIDILSVMEHSTDMEVRRKALQIAMGLLGSHNVEETVNFLQRELTKSMDNTAYEKNSEYRQILVKSVHSCAVRFGEVAPSVVLTLMDFLRDPQSGNATDVIAFVREVVEKYPDLRSRIVAKLFEAFNSIKVGKVYRGALWIAGEYAESLEDIQQAFTHIRSALGPLPIFAHEQRHHDDAATAENPVTENAVQPAAPVTKTRVLEDGTYATETAYTSAPNHAGTIPSTEQASLRSLLLAGEFYTGAVLAATLTKLVMRLSKGKLASESEINALKAEAMLMMSSIVRVGQSHFSKTPIDEDSSDRIMSCLQLLASGQDQELSSTFLSDTKSAYTQMITAQKAKASSSEEAKLNVQAIKADDAIHFRSLAKKQVRDDQENIDKDLLKATGTADLQEDFVSKLNKIKQLTGFSDSVYAEAFVTVHQFDIFLDVFIVNQTSEMLQNLTLDFATLGDLKLVEKPAPHTIAPHGYHSIKSVVKVSSTETGVIFGSIVYDINATDSRNVILNDIHVDIMDYIKPAYCNEAQFRSMWTEFEWENKVNVNANQSDLREYLAFVMKATNMSCLTPDASLSGDCGFLSANLYAKSLFGEDALANLSIELLDNNKITGHVRIRAKTQGIALNLGDRISKVNA